MSELGPLFAGRVALVTGASRGIGASIARDLAAETLKQVLEAAVRGQRVFQPGPATQRGTQMGKCRGHGLDGAGSCGPAARDVVGFRRRLWRRDYPGRETVSETAFRASRQAHALQQVRGERRGAEDVANNDSAAARRGARTPDHNRTQRFAGEQRRGSTGRATNAEAAGSAAPLLCPAQRL